ncbi:uncharacterized protein E0L32_008274 [Thyridium curvatum]|uniref:Uncharacterized protein n=1 Tax=Thyridium curvatum TaxID=1093900 RepID=A0A507AJZ9_9PEZI|nr:uncharacterized protein E0L32_008274 [Thyridium curvatum]TPX10705.1 hypothetical protein E0L32_008274 [Thyridium curvatum]
MGFDCGFDIFPRLELNVADKQAYEEFLREVIDTYGGVHDKEGRRADGKVLVLPSDTDAPNKVNIWFMVGECPHLPSTPNRCNYFLRFSSKVSGRLTTPAAKYINGVHEIARKHFGDRVHYWHEMNETGDERQWGYYDWLEVQKADKELEALGPYTKHEDEQGSQRKGDDG